MSLKKSQAYTLAIACTLGVYGTALLAKADLSVIYGPTLTAIVGLTVAYIGGNVVDNGVKGRFYNPALDGK
jgi:predicted sugar kinase